MPGKWSLARIFVPRVATYLEINNARYNEFGKIIIKGFIFFNMEIYMGKCEMVIFKINFLYFS